MALLSIQELVIDIPADRDSELAHFYASLLGYDGAEDAAANPRNPFLGREGFIDLGLQRVEGYLPPTWPEQERGAQIHLDVSVADLAAAVEAAIRMGATIAPEQFGDDYCVMLDPVGHPFCLVKSDDPAFAAENAVGQLHGICIDSADPAGIAAFYGDLTGGEITVYPGGWASVTGVTNPGLYFQPVPDFVPNSWPTQERGQQMHLDSSVDDVELAKGRVIELGGSVRFEHADHPGFAIIADPAGHLICISEARDS